MQGCPLGINIPGFIRLLREGKIREAYEKIKEQNFLPSICGRICSAPCEAACVLKDEDGAIGIRALERYAADFGKTRTQPLRGGLKGQKAAKIAIIGSGPSGLAAAVELAKKAYQVTIFESMDKPGGVLRYGIPEFRIPKKVLEAEIHEIKALGVVFETNCFVGRTLNLEELLSQGFAAILLATGAGIPQFMDIPGTHLGGVYYGEEFLMRMNMNKNNRRKNERLHFFLGSKVAVVGSGNTAFDCARVARRLGREVTLVFRRTESELRVRPAEVEFGKEEGIGLEPLVKPTEILGGGNHFVTGLKCVRMDYADLDESQKWQLIPVPDSEFVLDVDTVVMAVGHKPNSLIAQLSPDLQLNADGTIKIDEQTSMTSLVKVFACGNVVTNAGAVVEAIASGKQVAGRIDRYLK